LEAEPKISKQYQKAKYPQNKKSKHEYRQDSEAPAAYPEYPEDENKDGYYKNYKRDQD
jgi:hypothetical protein